MPDSASILRGLTDVANDFAWLAAVWHAALAAAVVAAASGRWRPGRRAASRLLVLPVLSVSLLAWLTGNPFNTAAFALLALGMLGTSWRVAREPARPGPRWTVLIGTCATAYGWVYPHFVEVASPWTYLVLAPFGLVPCPTLAVVTGLALVGGGLGSRAFSLVLAAAGLFYGLFGILRLGVALDAGLLVAACALALSAVHTRDGAPERSP